MFIKMLDDTIPTSSYKMLEETQSAYATAYKQQQDDFILILVVFFLVIEIIIKLSSQTETTPSLIPSEHQVLTDVSNKIPSLVPSLKPLSQSFKALINAQTEILLRKEEQ